MKICLKCQATYDDTVPYCLNDGFVLSLPDPYHLVGRTLLGKFRIDALVGIGGMGAVYSAHHLLLNRRIAFKILLPNLALGDKKLLDLFQQEAGTVGQLSHENIVDVKDAGRTPEDIAYMVMEWLEGIPLERELETDSQLSLERISELLAQIAGALDHAHARRIIHRDLKPSNIMLVHHKDGREIVKVVDFGIAKIINETVASPVSQLIGTPHYASPEQFKLGAEIDSRSDIYSLGVLLYQMLTGKLPFEAETAHELILLHRTEAPPPMRQYRADVPVAIEQLVNRLLAKEPQMRPQSAGEVFETFDRLRRQDDQAKTPAVAFKGTGTIKAEVTSNSQPTLLIGEKGSTYTKVTGKIQPSPTKASENSERGQASGTTEAINIEPPVQATAQKVAEAKKVWKPNRSFWLLSFAILLLVLAAIAIKMRQPSAPLSGQPVEVLNFFIEITDERTSRLRRGINGAQINEGESFRLHFRPRERGYLYLVVPNKENVPTTFLTAQPHPDTGVRSNFIEAGSEFVFPGGGNSIGVTKDERRMAFTAIFSPTPLSTPAFLAEGSQRELNATEQLELARLRDRVNSHRIEVVNKSEPQSSYVLLNRPEVGEIGVPVIFDVVIQSREN